MIAPVIGLQRNSGMSGYIWHFAFPIIRIVAKAFIFIRCSTQFSILVIGFRVIVCNLIHVVISFIVWYIIADTIC